LATSDAAISYAALAINLPSTPSVCKASCAKPCLAVDRLRYRMRDLYGNVKFMATEDLDYAAIARFLERRLN